MPMTVIEATGFSASAHSQGIVLAVLQGSVVALNIRLMDQGLVWLLMESLRNASRRHNSYWMRNVRGNNRSNRCCERMGRAKTGGRQNVFGVRGHNPRGRCVRNLIKIGFYGGDRCEAKNHRLHPTLSICLWSSASCHHVHGI